MEKKSILNWLNQLSKEGKKLSISWEGGNDSGWVYFQIDGEQVDNEYTESLVEYMYDTLDYGSWAGEFNANGTALYDAKARTFIGTDYYSYDKNDSITTNITIRIPKKLWFETLRIECESNYDETPNISVRFLIKNGFLTQEHSDICSNLEEVLKDEFDALFSNYESTDDHEFRSCNDIWTLERKDAIEENNMLVFKITNIEIGIMDSSEKDIVLKLTDEIIETIDENLNETENKN
jgi:hypothetical protein